ncbi:MAG: hypothetical protein ACLURP_15545 [Ruminococcus sp.]
MKTPYGQAPYSGQTGLSPKYSEAGQELAKAGNMKKQNRLWKRSWKKLRMYRFICPFEICFWILWRIIMVLMEIQLQARFRYSCDRL